METRSEIRLMAHHLIRALILGGIAFYIVRLVQTDNLALYIAPRMALYVKLAALGLYAVAAVQLFQALRVWQGRKDAAVCDCEHPPAGSAWKSAALYALFLVPLLAGFLTPDAAIGSAMAGKKGINLSAASTALPNRMPAPSPVVSATPSAESSPQPDGAEPTSEVADDKNSGSPSGDSLDALFPADQFTEAYASYGKRLYGQPSIEVTEKSYMEILTTLDLFLDRFVGKKLTISGFVYRDGTLPEGSFVIGRFAVQCCAADAMPYGVLVSSGKLDARLYDNDTWLRVTGTLEKTVYDGNEIMGIKLESAEKIKPAKDPYVYPDLDFGTDNLSGGAG